jgi:hypothetical protein
MPGSTAKALARVPRRGRQRLDRPITSFARWLGGDIVDGDRAAIARECEPRPGGPLRCEDGVNPLNLLAREPVLDVQEQPHQRLGDPDRLDGRHRRVNRVRIDDVLVDERGIVQPERVGGHLLIRVGRSRALDTRHRMSVSFGRACGSR